jgi:hypothetical protein
MRDLNKLFGSYEYAEEFADLPEKISGTVLSRFLIGEELGCTRCFPHGNELSNSHLANRQRSWKKHREKQYKVKGLPKAL